MNIKNIVKNIVETQTILNGRYKDGKRDLLKALPCAKPISESQKKEIMDFWEPFLVGKVAKKSFDIRWFDIYNRTNVFGNTLKYYIPDSFYYCVVDTFFSDRQAASVFDDKNMYDLYFRDVKQPSTICRKNGDVYLDSQYNIITEEKALSLCAESGNVILKPSVHACGGKGIEKWSPAKDNINDLKSKLCNRRNVVVQEFIKQHKVLADFNDSSVNTLRLVTLLFEGEVYLTTAVVIMGGKGALTNHLHSGGLVCGILPSGQLMSTAFDGKLNQYERHPNGIAFADCVIPNYDKCVEMVKRLAPRFSNISKLISWDITIDQDAEPVLIETNLTWGGSVQIAGGPVFGEMTEKVLNEVKNKANC